MTFFGSIYLIKNKINNKIYIGQTIKSIEKRFKEHCAGFQESKMPIQHAIKKYGKENFEIIPLMSCLFKDELNKMESYFISLFKSTTKDIGYNIMSGGYFLRNEEIENKRLRNLKAKLKIMDRTNSMKALEDNWNKSRGASISEERRLQLSEMSIKKRIKCYNLISKETIYFNSAKEASKFLNLNYGLLTRAARKERPKHKNWIFDYVELDNVS